MAILPPTVPSTTAEQPRRPIFWLLVVARLGSCGVETWGYPEGDTTADVSGRRNASIV